MKRTLASVAILLLIIALSAIVKGPSRDYYTGSFDNGNETVSVDLAVAETEAERMKGLMYTFFLPEDRGMIFVFPDENERSFWMKNTYIPLDIMFLDEDMRILNIESARPQPFSPESELNRYTSDGEAMYVIEMNQGFASRNDISESDQFIPGEKLRSCCS